MKLFKNWSDVDREILRLLGPAVAQAGGSYPVPQYQHQPINKPRQPSRNNRGARRRAMKKGMTT